MSFCGVVCMIMAMRAASGPIREMFPGVWVNVTAKVVEFDAKITPMLVKDERAPLFFLEVLACSPNTREHETFVVSEARPSNIHAAMLMIGLNPGKPGGWKMAGEKGLEAVNPTGDRVSVRIVYADKDGHEVEADPLEWVVNAKDHGKFVDAEKKIASAAGLPAPGWVFGGSKIVKKKVAVEAQEPAAERRSTQGEPGSENRATQEREVYDADGSGTIIGLTTFGSEVIGWSRTISPDASVSEPEWVADLERTSPAEMRVRVRIRAEVKSEK